VSRLNRPVAVTVTLLPIAPLQLGSQVRVMSLGSTVTTEPFDSRIARQITMFVPGPRS
jgi:hypothetical protein